MTYICIKCKKIWVHGGHTNEYSGGLCDTCTTHYIREKQKSRGFDDCFKRAIDVCAITDCSYWYLCNKDLLA
jgi:hypothetical protein